MNPDRWKRVEEIFLAAVEKPEGERTRWVDQACEGDEELRGEVYSLLASDDQVSDTFVEGRVQDAVVSFGQKGPDVQRVGPYELIRELGRGGMGTVFLARRADDQYQNEVAVKLVRPGMDTDFILARFRRERQILASLDHPNIARLLDGGTTPEGLPYIVMEYIRGQRINEHCKPENLSIEQRITLYLDVCAAVDHAHRHFVVHRDLKPGNILIDERGTPKLLDFGICKLLYGNPLAPEETMTQGVGMMTPDYASPEQVRGEPVTVVSDVYSLGAVLYELLTSVRPHRIGSYTPQAVERAICDLDVQRPSQAAPALAKQLEGDLDTILLKAMQKDPARRYASAEQLAQDLRRYLEHRPILARTDSVSYRAAKFLRRNRKEVIASALVLASLSGGMIASIQQARIAQQHLRQVQQLANTFVFDVHDSIRELPGATKARELIVERGAEHLDRLAAVSGNDATLDRQLAAAYLRLGEVQGNVMGSNRGRTTAARASFEKAANLLERLAKRSASDVDLHVDWLRVLRRLGDLDSYTRSTGEAVTVFRKGIAIGEPILKRNRNNMELQQMLASLYVGAARAQRLADELEAARDSSTRAVELLENLPLTDDAKGREHRSALAAALSAAGMNYGRLNQVQDALKHFQASVRHLEALVKAEPLNVAYKRELMLGYSHIGDAMGSPTLASMGDTAGAVQAYGKMAAIARELHEADRDDKRALADYGISLWRLANVMAPSDPQRAETFLKSMQVLDRAHEADPGNTMIATNRTFVAFALGDYYAAAKQREEALKWWRRSIEIGEAIANAGNTSNAKTLLSSYRRVADLAAQHVRREEAMSIVSKAIALGEASAKVGQKSEALGNRAAEPRAYALAGSVSEKLGDAVKAREWYEKSLNAWKPLVSAKGFRQTDRKDLQEVESAVARLSNQK